MDSMIMSTGELTYGGWDKPVIIDEDMLMSLTGDYVCDVCNEHGGDKISHTNSIYMKNGDLYASFDDDLDMEGDGFSPVVFFEELEEYNDYYKPVTGTGKLLSVDKVANPKNHGTIMWNSDDVPKIIDKGVDDKMSDELQDKIQENGALRQQLNDKVKLEDTLRNQNKELQETIKSQKEELEQLKAQIEDGDKELKDELKSTTDLLKKYQTKEKEAKLSLAKSVAEAQIEEDVENKEEVIGKLSEDLSKLSEGTLRAMKESIDKKSAVNSHDTAYKGASATAKDSTLDAIDEKESRKEEIDENSSFEDISEVFNKAGVRI